MKIYFKISLFLASLMFASCSKEENVIIEPPETEYVYVSDCIIDEVFWLPDNINILMMGDCNGTIKKINTLTRYVSSIEPPEGYIITHIYVSPDISDRFFYVAYGYQQDDTPFKLFSYHFATATSTVIKEGLTLHGGYGIRGNRFVIAGNPIEILNLDTGESEFIPENGHAGPLSPDGTQLLVYTTQGVMVYDFACQCTSMLLAGSFTDEIIWNNSGLFRCETIITNFPYTLTFHLKELISGDLLLSPENYSGGPWSAFNGTELLFFTYDPEIKYGESSSLISYDCNTKKISVILTCPTDRYYPNLVQSCLSVSPDQTKVAFRVTASHIQVSSLQ